MSIPTLENHMNECLVCGNKIIPFFSLGNMPLANAFLSETEIKKEKKFDLTVAFCPHCYLVQLLNTVNPKILFKKYIYFSSNVKTIIEHDKKTVKYLKQKLKLKKDSFILEIGSNDGVLLGFFKRLGMKTLGVDPAKNVAKVANSKGIKTIPEFFNYNLSKRLINEKYPMADLVYGANVFAHVPKIVDFVKGVKNILKENGTAVFEFIYLKGLVEDKFDSVYHEHVFYYSIISLKNLLKKFDLEIYDVEPINMQGGSLRIFVSHKGIHKISQKVVKIIKEEVKQGFDKIETYKNINVRITKLNYEITQLLKKLKNEKKKIVAYGAPAKGITLVNYFGIDKYFDFLVDISKSKQGLYTPGNHMYVYPPEKIYKEKPDYIFILCWNIADEVMKQLSLYKESGGKFILSIPKIKII